MFKLLCDETDITYGQRFLLNLLDERKLAAFCRDKGLKFEYTYMVAVGGNLPPAPLIYRLRSVVHPVLWFYREGEPRPEERECADDGGTEWDYTRSAGFQEFSKIKKLKGWAEERGFSYVSLWMIAAGRRAPSYLKIRQLREHVYPADWFFPPLLGKSPQTPLSGAFITKPPPICLKDIDEIRICE